MQPIDIEQVKRVLGKLGRQNPPQVPLASPALAKSQRGIQELVRSQLGKSGFPIDKLNKLMAAVRKEQRKLFEARLAETAKSLAADESALRQELENLGQAQRLLTNPFQTHLVTLDEPFLIWQYPHPQLDIFIDSGRVPNNSFIKIKVYVHSKDPSPETRFVFHFLWTNPSRFTVVVKARTSLIFNGFCTVEGDTQLIQGDQSYLDLSASHQMWRWSGWGNDPVTGDQTLIWDYFDHSLPGLPFNVWGGWPWEDVGFASQGFVFQPFSLNANPIVVPPLATIMYQVAVDLDYWILRLWSGESEFTYVWVDFADDDHGRRIICPGAVLEVFTPPPSKKSPKSSAARGSLRRPSR